MDIFFSEDHALHAPAQELHRGAFVTPHEGPHRMALLLEGLKQAGLIDFRKPQDQPLDRVTAVHSPAYIDFLQTAWTRWKAAGYAGDVLPMTYANGRRQKAPPQDIDGAAGYFCMSADTLITETSWQAALAGAHCALTAADHLTETGKPAFVLSRPPGHHAGADYMGGYCFLNMAAIAAQALRDNGATRIAILDVDFHHGNGTQDIFYNRDDVFFASIHGHPAHHFPYFWGHADETGAGAGEGYNANYPLSPGTAYAAWSEALINALERIKHFKPDALIISLGVDTYEHDPISAFKLKTDDYSHYGSVLGKLGLPTLFIMEGGYGVPEIGTNTANVLTGFMGV